MRREEEPPEALRGALVRVEAPCMPARKVLPEVPAREVPVRNVLPCMPARKVPPELPAREVLEVLVRDMPARCVRPAPLPRGALARCELCFCTCRVEGALCGEADELDLRL